MDDILLPIRIVQPSRDFLKRPPRKGRSLELKYFVEEKEREQHRNDLLSELDHIQSYLEGPFKEFPNIPNIIKAKLKSKALAKSNRPSDFLDRATCPIVGIGNMGELLLSTTKFGLKKLKEEIENPRTDKEKANITAIDDLKIFTEKDKLLDIKIEDLIKKAKRDDGIYLKAITFNHQDDELNINTIEKFTMWIKKMGLNIEKVTNFKNFLIWKIVVSNDDQIKEIVKHPAIRTLSFFPKYKIIRPKTIETKKNIRFPLPNEAEKYASVGVIDTGIPKNHPSLSQWVLESVSFIPENYTNRYHGTAVAGLICFGNNLNGNSICPDQDNIKIASVELIPNSDPSRGETEEVHEEILMSQMEEAVPNLSKKHGIKVWNMSAGLNLLCEDEKFSDLAVFFDKLQDENGIVFTLPSGNVYRDDVDLRAWPPNQDIDYGDQLQVPGDSVRSITVGSIACKESPNSVVGLNEPANYSCRGPGPMCITKPDCVHYSGNVSLVNGNLTCSGQGIYTIDEDGKIVEDAGTSFSSPLLARTLSLIHNNLIPEPSINLIKALTIHNCDLPKDLGNPESVFQYVGHGKPPSIKSILGCTENEITLIFEQEIFQGFELEYPIIWPKSLIDENGKCKGKIKMTLVAEPPLDSNFGSEYIRANISAALQTGIFNKKKGKVVWDKKVGETPNSSDLRREYELDLIRHGYKWKAIKRYEKNFTRGTTAGEWRLKVNLLLRDGVALSPWQSIKFALIVTISDPQKNAPVYNEVVNEYRNIGILTNEIQLRSRIKQRV